MNNADSLEKVMVRVTASPSRETRGERKIPKGTMYGKLVNGPLLLTWQGYYVVTCDN